jgi:threonine dehydrogenase-like Zn-dependent dehydrogenase
MRALVYHGPAQKAWEEAPDPEITDDGDVIVRVDAVTIRGTDLHILKGDVPAVRSGRILGHEAVGTVEEAGDGVRRLLSAAVHHPSLRPGRVRPGLRRIRAGGRHRRAQGSPQPLRQGKETKG